MDKIKKRNGTYAAFDPAKIQTAIMKANVRVAEEPMTEEDLSFLTQRVVKKLEKENEIPDVEHIQDIVERTLSKAGYSRTAKAYILYRAEHAKMREMRDTLPEIFSNLTFKAASEVDMKRENANINTDTAMGTMLKFGTESAKDYFDKFILPPHITQADHDGDIHIHDKDFYTITETCCQIDLLKLFKDGFSTGHGYLREPNSIRSYAALACIAIQANQNEMHGGQAVPNFDYAMADGVRKTYRKSFLKHLAETLENKGIWPIGTGYQALKKMNLNVPTLGQANEQKWPDVFDNKIHEALDTYGILSDEDYRYIASRAYMDTVEETHQAMEAVIHNLNSMHCYGENSSIWAYNHETEELNTVTIGEICETFKPKKWSVFAVNPRTGITELKYITAVQKVGNHRDMVTIKTKTGQKTRMTTNHRMITLDENANIVERYPDETTLALAPKGIKLPENHAPVHDLWKYCERCGKPYANSPKTARYISITPELAELFGYYVADGSTIGKQTAVTFTVCNKIKGEHLKHLMDKAFNADFTMHLTYYTAKTGKSEIKDYRFNTGTHIAKFFKDMCGENAASKKVPQDILQGSKNLFQVFYRAYIACDGHNAKTVSFSSVSKKLRDQINMLCMAYGELPSYSEHVKYHPTKNTPCPKRYDANLNRTGAQRLGIDVINKPQVTLPKYNLTIATRILKNNGVKWGPTDCGRIPFRRTRQVHYDELQNVMAFHNKTFGLSHLLNLYPIDIIEKTYDNSEDENVYDITVEDYENFLTDECIFVHNSRAGAQVPFSSINYGTDTSPEGQLAIREILNATEDGLGNGETPIFPVQIFKVKEGINYNPGDPNYSLFKQAMRVSAKRLFPNFSFMDAPFNKQYLGKHPDKPWYDEVGYMGCRTRVMANVYDPENEITPGRGNLSFTSINLPRVAIQSRNMVNEKGEFNSPTNMEKFYRILDERIDLCIEQLLHRFKIQCSKHAYNYPFLMGEGVWINSEKLSPTDTLETVLKHGTLSVGFIGLAETLVALTGKHHGESEESWKLGYEIIKYMRERMDQACKKYRLNLSLLATPGEGLSGTFVRIDKKKYGIIPGVTDREYYTNSFHVPVYYNISAFDKIKKEAPFHELTNAGHISYVEVDGDIAKNLDAFEAIIRCMKESGIGYGSINHPVDRDPICGYVGIINEVCPRCGRRENEAVSLEKLEELKKKYRNMPDITKYIH